MIIGPKINAYFLVLFTRFDFNAGSCGAVRGSVFLVGLGGSPGFCSRPSTASDLWGSRTCVGCFLFATTIFHPASRKHIAKNRTKPKSGRNLAGKRTSDYSVDQVDVGLWFRNAFEDARVSAMIGKAADPTAPGEPPYAPMRLSTLDGLGRSDLCKIRIS